LENLSSLQIFRALPCYEKSLVFRKNSILPLIISATEIVSQSLLENLKILDLGNTLVVEIQKQNIIKHKKVKMCNYVD
jgi:hypothetical protein